MNTCSTTETVNVVTEYIDMYCDRNIKDHDTEYQYSINIDEGGTSVDVIELPSYTPSICKIHPSIDAPSNGNSRETDTCSACNKRKGTRVDRLNLLWFLFFCNVGPSSIQKISYYL